jgi:formylglycine-generating enzyme required for sulfatase activity
LPEQKWTGDLLPAHDLSYEDLRGGSNVADWPKHGHFVADGSVLGLLRDRCGQQVDLLTEAQWCFASGMADDPRRVAGGGWTVANGEARMDELAWTSGNSGHVLHEVAGKEKNPYGLYDMHGNGGELVLDWCLTVMSPESVTDPTGPESRSVSGGKATLATYDGSGTETVGRAFCGGTAATDWYYASAVYRNWWSADDRSHYSAVRLGAQGTAVVTEREGD